MKFVVFPGTANILRLLELTVNGGSMLLGVPKELALIQLTISECVK